MLAIPAIEGWRNIDCPVDKRCIERHRERQESQGTNAKRKSQRERIKGARCQPGDNQCRNQQTIAVYERQEGTGHGKCSSRKQKNTPWSKQTSDVDAKRPDKHKGPVEGATEPCPLVETKADVALQISKP